MFIAAFETIGPILIVVVLVAVSVAASVLLHQRRRTIWKRFAARHRLSCDIRGEIVRVDGSIAGRQFALLVSKESSDTGEFGVEDAVMKLKLRRVPASLTLETNAALSTAADVPPAADSGFAADSEELGGIESNDRKVAADYLTPRRRAALLQLQETCNTDSVRIEDGYLCLCNREAYSSMDELETRLQQLSEAANTLDADET